MNNTNNNRINLIQTRRRHQRWVLAMVILGVLVSSATFMTLRYNAVAKTYQKRILDCHELSGTVAHIHNDDCYADGVLVCPLEEIEPHEHTEACYTAVLSCGLMESEGHVHTEACFIPQMELACGLEETDGDETHPAHHHTVECYAPVRELICGLEETPGDETHPAHWHTDACYQDVLLQVCGMEEGFGAHYHTDECYQQVLTCEKPVLPVHVHGAECFRTEEMTEEEIAAMNLAESTEASESESTSEEGLTNPEGQTTPVDEVESESSENTETTGDEPAAGTQSAEEDANTEAGQEPESGKEPTDENADNAVNYPEQIFKGEAAGLLVSVNAPAGAFPQGTEMVVSPIEDEEVLNAATAEVQGEVVLVQGVDITFLDADGNEIEPLVPIQVEMVPSQESAEIIPDITEVSNEQTLIHVDNELAATVMEQEDNTTPEVRFESDSFSAYIVVYTRIEKTVLASDGHNYRITVTCDPASEIPADASLEVEEIPLDSEIYDSCWSRTEAALAEDRSLAFARFFDISIHANGAELQPSGPVQVKIELADLPEETLTADTQIVHFGESAEILTPLSGDGEISFQAKSFSVYGVVYTVDFHYEVNGKTYDFSIPGGGFASFTDLVEVLGIARDTGSGETVDEAAPENTEAAEGTPLTLGDVVISDSTRKFVANVASIEFSTPSLVDVSRVESETTVGQIKQVRGLACEYSAELTEEQIAEINAQTVKAGDWALISLLPFESEESLTVTMKNGEAFTILVTDAQIKKTVIDAQGDTWEITVTYGKEAEIPDGAQLDVAEITEPELYDQYMQRAAEAVEQEIGENSLLSGRFFDIQIKYGEDTIEPKAPVNVTIRYVEAVSLGKEDSMSAIHFTEDGIDLIEVNPEKNEKGGTEISFEQGSFSVTGTIITSGVISNGNYCILYKNGDSYYAMANDGSAVQVSVEDGTVKTASGEDLPASPIWTRSGQVWRGNQNTGMYLRPANGSATGNNSSITITSSDDSEGNEVYTFYRTEQGYYYWQTTTYYLRFINGTFTGGTSNSSNQFYLARIESDTNLKIHYGYLDGSGSYVEWPELQETLRNPNMLGDQYDVRMEIPGFEYITTRLNSATGNDIIHLLQTEQDKNDGGNVPISADNNKTAVWRFRETTKDNAIYPTWSGIAYDYRLEANILGDQDIYVVYRPNTKIPSSPGGQGLDDIDAPHISKEKQDNGDGTYDIDLSVTAEAESSSHSGRANVVIVLDTSGSMNESASSGGTKWSLVTSSVKSLSTDLLGLNAEAGGDPSRVEFVLVNFSNYVKNENWIFSVGPDIRNHHFFTDANAFNNEIDSLQVQGGTCWDKAMSAANSILWDDNDPVYVVFISDGDTNSRAFANGNYDLWDGGTYVDNSYSTDYDNNINAKYNVDSATYFADKIREKGGTVYTVGITGGGNLVNLYRLTHGTAASHPNHYDVSDSAGIQDAFTSIKNSILSSIGYQSVVVTDGLTGMTQTALVNGNAGNFSYTVAKYTEAVQKLTELPEGVSLRSTKDANGNITSYARNTGADSGTYPYILTTRTVVSGSPAIVTKNNDGTLTIEFPDGTSDTVDQASYDESTKTVTWNYGDDYQLRDGYTYTVTFTVWPNQASYDLLAALRNGLLKWGDHYTYTDESGTQQTIPFADYSAQIDRVGDDYALRSNVESGNKVNYYKVSSETLTSLPPWRQRGHHNRLRWCHYILFPQRKRYLYENREDAGDSGFCQSGADASGRNKTEHDKRMERFPRPEPFE